VLLELEFCCKWPPLFGVNVLVFGLKDFALGFSLLLRGDFGVEGSELLTLPLSAAVLALEGVASSVRWTAENVSSSLMSTSSPAVSAAAEQVDATPFCVISRAIRAALSSEMLADDLSTSVVYLRSS